MQISREELFDVMVIYIVSKKLDVESRLQWERSLVDSRVPSLSTFMKSLDNHARITASVSSSRVIPKNKHQILKTSIECSQRAAVPECAMCKENHILFKCEQFLKLPIVDRVDTVKRLRLCFNCLR